MIITVEKLFNYDGKLWADVRDYQARECMKKKEDIRIVHNGYYMDIKANKIYRTKKLITKQPIKSIIYQGQEYYLWSYEWVGAKVVPSYKIIN